MAPAISQANDALPSLIIHLAVTNVGGQAAILTNLVVHGMSKGRKVSLTLHAQKILDNKTKYASLPLNDERLSSVFLPILVQNKEAAVVDLYCAPYASQLPLKESDVLSIDELKIDIWLNGERKPQVFVLGYQDYHDKFKGNGILEIPKTGFSPRWYHDVNPVQIRGSVWQRQIFAR